MVSRMTQLTQWPLRNASSLNPASTIAFVIALAAKTRMGGDAKGGVPVPPLEPERPTAVGRSILKALLGWGHERTRIRPGFGWRVLAEGSLLAVGIEIILKSCFLGIRLRQGFLSCRSWGNSAQFLSWSMPKLGMHTSLAPIPFETWYILDMPSSSDKNHHVLINRIDGFVTMNWPTGVSI